MEFLYICSQEIYEMSEFPSDIILRNDHKIIFVVLDGLGGLPLSK